MRRLRLERQTRRSEERPGRRPARALASVAAATAVALTASGCVTVHGGTAVVPGATAEEAAAALTGFVTAFNRADKANDPALAARQVTGPLGAINQAGLKSRSVTQPGGNPDHRPLELRDARFLVPRKAGWPRWFVADTDANRDDGTAGKDNRWLVAFVRNGPDDTWKAAHLVITGRDGLPRFAEEQGDAVAVAAGTDALAVAPGALSGRYTAYLKDGGASPFAAGPHTSEWREKRARTAQRPGLATQFIDRAADSGDFAPLALRTEDGGALIFFASRHFERQTTAKGYRPKVGPDLKALMKGEVVNTVTKEWVSSQAVVVKPAGTERDAVAFAGRLQGVVAVEGS
ncbi:putative lipoprotein [Streptomyces omiyaensis]|uniref:hypothetical protein n=1 Tax=Streptomyces omiyaensis TaxID=68247 RepID=UPI001673D720|nr:hypothetical protein [Streptomyces omiyaensis]GGY79354.1 putative lipoprotein [Streptomyces omiyaensis]